MTINDLIEKYGLPNFCKIDVEGFEYEVLVKLEKPIPIIAFEFHLDNFTITLDCLRHLDRITNQNRCYLYNFSFMETTTLDHENWIDSQTVKKLIQNTKGKGLWGNIYAKFS